MREYLVGHQLVEQEDKVGHLLGAPRLGVWRSQARRVRVQKLEQQVLEEQCGFADTVQSDTRYTKSEQICL